MILLATHTHLYPGHRGRISGLAQIADLGKGRDCLVEFSDGAVAAARISRALNDWLLDTKAYRTAAGTDIGQKRWLVRLQEGGGEPAFLIVKHAQGN